MRERERKKEELHVVGPMLLLQVLRGAAGVRDVLRGRAAEAVLGARAERGARAPQEQEAAHRRHAHRTLSTLSARLLLTRRLMCSPELRAHHKDTDTTSTSTCIVKLTISSPLVCTALCSKSTSSASWAPRRRSSVRCAMCGSLGYGSTRARARTKARPQPHRPLERSRVRVCTSRALVCHVPCAMGVHLCSALLPNKSTSPGLSSCRLVRAVAASVAARGGAPRPRDDRAHAVQEDAAEPAREAGRGGHVAGAPRGALQPRARAHAARALLARRERAPAQPLARARYLSRSHSNSHSPTPYAIRVRTWRVVQLQTRLVSVLCTPHSYSILCSRCSQSHMQHPLTCP